jgi:hypothetical protein
LFGRILKENLKGIEMEEIIRECPFCKRRIRIIKSDLEGIITVCCEEHKEEIKKKNKLKEVRK